MKVLHVISGIDPASGGPTRSVTGICRALDNAGVEVSLFVLHGRHEFSDRGHVNVIYGTMPKVEEYNLVHLQGLWDWGLHSVAAECRRTCIPYIISPRGMLDPWALSVKAFKKRLALWLYQMKDLRNAMAFHVTAQAEANHVHALGLRQPCIIAPNGVDMPDAMPPKHKHEEHDGRKAIFLSRLHPGKGLLNLAEAWAKVRPLAWTMEVIGPDSYGHKAEVLDKLDVLGIKDQWHFAGMLNDEEKWKAYRSADLLIHPSISENFGITIAEGLAAELPVIATVGAPWGDLVKYKCGWWIEQGVGPLVDALRLATTISDSERHEMGFHGRQLVEEKYIWDAVVKKMVTSYRGLINA